jgi:hypothetical protein
MECFDGRNIDGSPSNIVGLSFPGTLFLARVDGRSTQRLVKRVKNNTVQMDRVCSIIIVEMSEPLIAIPSPFTFSQSSLQDYSDCPRRFQLRYIEQLQWPAVEAEPVMENEHHQQEGQLFHRMVQQHRIGLPDGKLAGMNGFEQAIFS